MHKGIRAQTRMNLQETASIVRLSFQRIHQFWKQHAPSTECGGEEMYTDPSQQSDMLNSRQKDPPTEDDGGRNHIQFCSLKYIFIYRPSPFVVVLLPRMRGNSGGNRRTAASGVHDTMPRRRSPDVVDETVCAYVLLLSARSLQ